MNDMEKSLYQMFREAEKKYYAYLIEKEKQLTKAETNAEYTKIKDGIEGRFEFFAKELANNGVIAPPCKVGDTVYFLDNGKIKQSEVFEISIHSDGILVHTNIQFCLEVEQVFLTKEEAEKALKERS